ncbi:4-hydroxy-tetrahydrodipicolinate reductase [Inhella gelatinilytica]|uniref:4-hydroxy-tetrahydrodipicolinate reductase n=1 Tax=Inhella gelatinilytica TaxID=2795030 RepID=A0A931IXM5_9BURK|nr:4-hydroxy-tetrahydrodipicolinate reductase [Inhella gelatinilytica]MBH9551731.1 4-hydroxy-tetrahydrodipicolinate reductase [Inhella gelatinilytica]
MSPRLRIALAGASGRMGQMLVQQILASSDCLLVGAGVSPQSGQLGQDAAQGLGQTCGVRFSADLNEVLADAQVLIDYSRVESSLRSLVACETLGLPLVIGTTGFGPGERERLAQAGQRIPVLWAPNTSIGVNVVMALLEQAARQLNAGYDIEIVEAHHRHKVDAPSGTALQMGEVMARAQGHSLAEVATYTREGHTGPREAGRIGFSTVRGGDIVGDHTVMFCGEGERIEIAHKSSSRVHYAQGALHAARWLANQAPGLYAMRDCL